MVEAEKAAYKAERALRKWMEQARGRMPYEEWVVVNHAAEMLADVRIKAALQAELDAHIEEHGING